MSNEEIRRKLDIWMRERNTCAEAQIHYVDSRHAHRLGLAVLGELLRLRGDLGREPGPTNRTVIERLAFIIALARGDAQDRLTAAADEPVEIPGPTLTPAYGDSSNE